MFAIGPPAPFVAARAAVVAQLDSFNLTAPWKGSLLTQGSGVGGSAILGLGLIFILMVIGLRGLAGRARRRTFAPRARRRPVRIAAGLRLRPLRAAAGLPTWAGLPARAARTAAGLPARPAAGPAASGRPLRSSGVTAPCCCSSGSRPRAGARRWLRG